MILTAPANTNYNTSQTTVLYDNNMSTEEYYKQQNNNLANDVFAKNAANKYEVPSYMNNNNNTTLLPSEMAYMEKMSTNSLLGEIEPFKPMQNNIQTNTLINNNSSSIDEQRALQLTLELSMLGLTNEEENAFNDLRGKKSMNMTECVPVPSSEHVAEIVGRQGCKIKALRAKTNTYIKTPVRGEEPVFVVTGRKEDVCLAKREILQAAEHFSQIRASRRNSSSLSPLGSPSPTAPGHITKQVRVPYRVVGLVVGPKGSTIKRIQQATNTYIVTPSRDKEPVFEVTGLPENVDRAKREVEHHIALRTGGIIDPTHPDSNDHLLNGFSNGLFSPTGSGGTGSFSALLDNNHLSNHLTERAQSMDSYSYLSGQSSGSSKFSELGSATNSPFSNNAFFYDTVIPSPTTDFESMANQFDPAPGSPAPSLWPDMMTQRNIALNRTVGSVSQPMAASRSLSVSGISSSNNSGRSSPAHLRRLLSESANDSTSYNGIQTSYSQFNGTPSINSTVSTMAEESVIDISKLPVVGTSDGESQSSSPDWMNANKMTNLQAAIAKKQCCVCQSSKVVAALVPCGHNLFCMECAERVKEAEGECPACQKKIEAILRIFS